MWFILSLRNAFRNLRRTCAILFTIALGTGALFCFDGFINGVLKELKYNTIHSNYGFGQIHTAGYREKNFADPTKHWISNGDEVEDFLYEQDAVQSVFPRVSFSALLKHGSIAIGGMGQGVVPEREDAFFQSLHIEEGEALGEEAHGILLGRNLADSLQVHPGDVVTVIATSTKGIISKGEFRVTGIFHTGALEFDRRVFRIPLPDAQKILKTTKIELFSLELRDEADWDGIATAVETQFSELEATPFHILDKVYYQHSVDWLKAQFHVVQIIILSIVLLGIFNTISSAILERKQEIGNLRANGESVWQIMQLILSEGGLLACIGSSIGMLLTYFLLVFFVDKGLVMPPGPGQTRPFLATFSFQWSTVFFTLVISVGAALIASFFAGLKIARMPIGKALRSS